MGFWDAVKNCMSKYVTFSGRASRPEYWYFFLFSLVMSIIAAVVDGTNGYVFSAVTAMALLLPGVSAMVRRLHDQDKSAWWLLVGVIPLIGGLVLLCFVAVKGTAGENRFGPASTPPT